MKKMFLTTEGNSSIVSERRRSWDFTSCHRGSREREGGGVRYGPLHQSVITLSPLPPPTILTCPPPGGTSQADTVALVVL